MRDNLRTLYAAIEQGFSAPLPAFVREELEGYVDCGVLSRGFAVLACPECSERIVVGFSCKGLGFCPSCLGRRMAETAANLVEHVLQKDPIRLRPSRDLEYPKGLCAAAHGFSLHAATTARADDPVGREALCKYILRPPIAQQNIRLVSDDLVRLELKRPFSDGTFALDLDPLSLLVRLATTVPPPRFHSVRYAGVFAAASKWRARVVPPPTPPTESDATHLDCSTCTAKTKPPTHRSGYRPWRELLMRSFKIDVEHCESCGARMKLRALVMTTASIERYLRWLGEPIDPPTLSPARDPPYFKSHVIRRRLGEPAQAELFDAH